jgi:flagellar motor switch protein FliM
MEGSGFGEATEAAVMKRGGDFDAGMPRFPAGDNVEFDQAQIDKLLGLDSSGGREKAGGMRELIDSSLVSHERLPMLEVAFDRMVRLLTTSLR